MIDILQLLQQRLQPMEGGLGLPATRGLPAWLNDPAKQGTLAGLPAAIRPAGQEDALAAFKAQLMGGQAQPPAIPPDLLAQMQRWWSATQEPQQSALNQMMSR
jgi:hypothetical protein